MNQENLGASQALAAESWQDRGKNLEVIASTSDKIAEAIASLSEAYPLYEGGKPTSIWNDRDIRPLITRNLLLISVLNELEGSFYDIRNLAERRDDGALPLAIKVLRDMYEASFGTIGTTDKEMIQHWHEIHREVQKLVAAGETDPDKIIMAIFQPLITKYSKK